MQIEKQEINVNWFLKAGVGTVGAAGVARSPWQDVILISGADWRQRVLPSAQFDSTWQAFLGKALGLSEGTPQHWSRINPPK